MSYEADKARTRYGFESHDAVVSQTNPGPGAVSYDVVSPDSFEAHRVREYPTSHLIAHHDRMHRTLFTPEGMHEFDGDKRDLINLGLARRAVQHELTLRGHYR